MAKPKSVHDDITFDIDFDPVVAAQKLPTNVTEGVTPLSDFMEIPCTKIIPYQSKQESDFRPWSEDRFSMLVESISKVGVLEPVTVRPAKDKPGYYEMLAGEHRWKASIEAGKETVPAHVMRICSDEQAANIFAITNLLRRENSILDKINGWWHYKQATRYKRGKGIEQLVAEGIISKDFYEQAQKNKRMVERYARMHNLIGELLELADMKKLGVMAGEQLAHLTEEQQVDILPYKDKLNDLSKAQSLHQLAEGKLDGKQWCKEEIELIMNPKKTTSGMQFVTSSVKKAFKEKIPKSSYQYAEQIITEALDLYLELHPEHKKQETTEESE